MDRRKVCILVALLLVFIAIEVTTAGGQGDGNNGDDNGNGNGSSDNGNGNNGSGNDGNDDGNGSKGDGNGNGSKGDGNGDGSKGGGNGNGSKGDGNGNGSNDGNGNGSNDGNGNGSNDDGNGNGSNGDVDGNGNGNGNKGDGNGNGSKGDGNGNGSNGNNNGNGSNGNGNNSDGNGHDNSGNGNGNGNNGNGNGTGNKGNGNGNGNNSNGNGNNGNNGTGNDNKDEGKDNGKSNPPTSAVSDYDQVAPVPGTGQERAFCKVKGACYNKTLTCPSQCPKRKPKNNKKEKGCFMDCSSKCEATCKSRKPSCDGYGSICYDPRFVGGDGMMFYFHGAKGSDYAIVSDENLQINAHFIGSRPAGRTRDYTWVQALSVMFDSHTLVLAAKKVSHWDDKVDALTIRWDGEFVNIPTDGETEWRTNSEEREVVVERTDATNTVRVTVAGLVEVDVKVTPIGEQENKVHNYQLPSDDAFAHLETQFRYFSLSDLAEGILGMTYRPHYVSPVKRGVPMPTMGGEDKYQTPSLYSPVCKVCRFQRPSAIASI